MDRREFVIGAAALASLAGGARAATVDDLKAAAREGWVYGVPLMEMARLRAAAVGDRPGPGTAGYNAFAHARAPVGPNDRTMSAAEPDVLYSSAWIDLSADGVRIDLPPTGGRYVSFALFDMYGNAIETVDGKEIGEHGHSIELVGPAARLGAYGYSAPVPRLPHMGPTVRAPGKWIWALARLHIQRGDLDAAHKLQDGFQVRAKPKDGHPAPPAARDAPWSDYFFALQRLIVENPPPFGEADFFRRIAPLQLGMDGGFERARFADEDLAPLAAGADEGRQVVVPERATEEAIAGWVWPKADVGDYGQDFLYRAQMVLAQPGSPPAAVVYSLRAAGPDGALSFAGERHWRLTLPGAPPAAGFWSLTLYEAAPDGRLFLTENPLGRHSIGAWTEGLRRGDDGTMEVWIGRSDPGGRHTANWLPAPADAPFALVLRGYAPEFALTERKYTPSAVEALGLEARARR